MRVLEYFQGILFLTTNRVETIDSAFQSRIHLAIFYPPLSPNARRELWKDWIIRSSSGHEPSWPIDPVLDELMNKDVNGREIKNLMRIAHSMARKENREIRAADILQGLEALGEFKVAFRDGVMQRKAEETKGGGLLPVQGLTLRSWLSGIFKSPMRFLTS